MFRIIFLALGALAPTASWADDEIKCNPEGSQLELNACARDDFTKADNELNQIYQSLINQEAADKLFISKLRLAQKAWLSFRDTDFEATFAYAEGDIRVCWGSMYPLSFMSRKAELTRERTKHLQQLLKDRGE